VGKKRGVNSKILMEGVIRIRLTGPENHPLEKGVAGGLARQKGNGKQVHFKTRHPNLRGGGWEETINAHGKRKGGLARKKGSNNMKEPATKKNSEKRLEVA